MTKTALCKILKDIPKNATAYIRNRNGDKLCIKENSKNESNKVSYVIEEEYLLIQTVTKSDKKTGYNLTYIAYENILQIDAVGYDR